MKYLFSIVTLCKEDREAFEDLMDMCRNYASESSMATNPIVFEPMVISILTGQQKKILQLERKLAAFAKHNKISLGEQNGEHPQT